MRINKETLIVTVINLLLLSVTFSAHAVSQNSAFEWKKMGSIKDVPPIVLSFNSQFSTSQVEYLDDGGKSPEIFNLISSKSVNNIGYCTYFSMKVKYSNNRVSLYENNDVKYERFFSLNSDCAGGNYTRLISVSDDLASIIIKKINIYLSDYEKFKKIYPNEEKINLKYASELFDFSSKANILEVSLDEATLLKFGFSTYCVLLENKDRIKKSLCFRLNSDTDLKIDHLVELK